jgi:two-component system, chemotaxis family, protein-glutamate methylesterase/glutaminase
VYKIIVCRLTTVRGALMKVLIVDDSVLMRNILKEAFQEAGVEVLGEAGNGRAAIEMNARLSPDLIVMDFNMPVMNGLEATKAIAQDTPTPIIIFSNEVDAALSFEALQAGAAEVLRKPEIDRFNNPEYTATLLATFRAAIHAKPGLIRSRSGVSGARTLPAGTKRHLNDESGTRRRFDAVVIGASTGGPVAVRQILSALPPDYPLGIAVVQHIEERFDAGYAAWLNDACGLTVRLARDPDRFTPGEVVVAPGNRHLVCADRALRLDDGPKLRNQKPSVDVLFETAARYCRDRVIAVLLTGMGSDGAEGCVRIKETGGVTVVQDEATSFIYGMPKAAVEKGGAVEVLPLGSIAPFLMEAAGVHA